MLFKLKKNARTFNFLKGGWSTNDDLKAASSKKRSK